jgi:hypothetical protein
VCILVNFYKINLFSGLESIDKQEITKENSDLDEREPEMDFTHHNFYDSDFDDEPEIKKKKYDHSSDDDWKPDTDSDSDSYSSCDSCDDDEIIEFTGWDDEPLVTSNEPKE